MFWLAPDTRADARRLVPRRRLPDVLQGQVARLARAPRRRRRRRAPCCRSTTTARRSRRTSSGTCEADLLDDFGFSEWVGPEPHGLGKHNTGTVKDPFTADETIALLRAPRRRRERRAVADGLLVPEPARRSRCSGVIALTQGLRYHPSQVPHVEQAPTRDEDLSTKPAASRATSTLWGRIARAAAVDRDAPEVLLPAAGHGRRADHARARRAAGQRRVREHDRGLQLRSRRHAGRPRRHAREVAQRLRGGAARAVHRLQPAAPRRRPRARHPDQPRRPDPDAARPRRASTRTRRSPSFRPTTATRTRSSAATSPTRSAPPSRRPPAEPVLFMTDDEISEGSEHAGQPVPARRPKRLQCTSTVEQPNHSRPSSPRSTSTASSTSSSSPATTTTSSSGPSPASATSACAAARRSPSPSPSPTSTSSTTSRSTRSRSATSRTPATPTSARARCSSTMLGLLHEQLARQAPHALSRRGPRLPPARQRLTPQRATRKPRFPVELSGVFALRASTR